MAGATAFFSFFALPPIVIILSNVLGWLFNDRYQQISGQLFNELADLFGAKSANQLEDISRRLQVPKTSFPLTVLSFVLLLVASTTLFSILKKSLNQLWRVKRKSEKRTFLAVLTDKLTALAIIIGSGLLLSASLAIEQFMARVSIVLSLSSTDYYYGLINFGHLAVSIMVRTVWFAMLLRVLPDVKVAWRAVWLGAFFTSMLFKVGEGILNYLLIDSQVGLLYGKAGAVILLLLFVFYSSLIFYYGAAFTRQFSEANHLVSQPDSSATAYTITDNEPPVPKEGGTGKE